MTSHPIDKADGRQDTVADRMEQSLFEQQFPLSFVFTTAMVAPITCMAALHLCWDGLAQCWSLKGGRGGGGTG